MTAAERGTILTAIGTCLEQDIHADLMVLFATAVSLTEKHPEQVNNEVRNAVTHLARAYAANSAADAQDELRRARGHVDRAKRDCLKISIIALHDKIRATCSEIKIVSGTLDPAFVVRRNDLTNERKRLLKDEIAGAPGIVNEYLTFFAAADQLHTDLTNELNLGTKRASKFKLLKVAISRGIWGMGGALIFSFVCGYAFAIAVPHPETARADIVKIFQKRTPTTAAPAAAAAE